MRDLERAIKEVQQLPDTITMYDDSVASNDVITDITTQDFTTLSTTGSRTCVRDDYIASTLTLRKYSTGKYFSSGSTKYWTTAYGGDVKAITTGGVPGLFWQITSIRNLTNRVFNAYKTNSYLRLDYDITVTCYLGIKDGYAIPINKLNLSGYSNFGTSYIT